MPDADVQPLVIPVESGHQRINKSWIIGRIFRDFESRAEPFSASKSSPKWEALRISIFEVCEDGEQGSPSCDWVWYSGFATIALQLAIAIVPLALDTEWVTLVLVMGGTLLAWMQAILPGWRSEKWDCPRDGPTVAITKGNGGRNVMLIQSHPRALDLHILSTGMPSDPNSKINRVVMAIFAALWTTLLISVAGLKQGSWCTYCFLDI